MEVEDAPSEAACSTPPVILKEPPVQNLLVVNLGVIEDMYKNFNDIDASEHRIRQGKYLKGSSSLEVREEIFPMEYHLGKGVTINLKPKYFWRIF